MIHLTPTLTADKYTKHLYINSFPKHERRLWTKQLELLKQNQLKLLKILNEEQEVGFIFYWQLNKFAFIEHFAIDPNARGGGIGSQVMNKVAEILKTIILEVEPPLTEMAKRRINFYERLGYQTFNDTYLQPPYNPHNPPLELRLMYLNLPSELTYEEVKNELYSTVYK
ncbi:N-acetyltransferase [Chitinophaga silvatica]|uniref:N-acetyltransferase n=1 Tax=Chitinophaga silvatica TaxID=2282649 RepID=A0A3E1YDB8_9BACT|nr:GNAT family N-acetyltransferase [Chitinophaga silvatica]RFS24464.1 N-acetyltransferase [Chitinophaga silvatica]